LVGDDGQAVLAISEMRCVAYEAAVPQKRQATIKESPFMKVTWNVDIDTLTAESPVSALSVKNLVAIAGFKKPGLKVLDISCASPSAIPETTDLISYTVTATSDTETEEMAQAISRFEHATALKYDPTSELETQGLKQSQFGLVLPGPLVDGSKIHWLLTSGGRVVADKKTCESLGERFSVLNLSNGTRYSEGNR
jgi:hypothetical protein